MKKKVLMKKKAVLTKKKAVLAKKKPSVVLQAQSRLAKMRIQELDAVIRAKRQPAPHAGRSFTELYPQVDAVTAFVGESAGRRPRW